MFSQFSNSLLFKANGAEQSAGARGPLRPGAGDSNLLLLSGKTRSVSPWEEHTEDQSVDWGKMEQIDRFCFSLPSCGVEQSIDLGGRVSPWKPAAAWRRKDLGSAVP